MPFETAAQAAGHPVWNSNSKVTLSGSARIAKGNTYEKTTAYDFVKAGDSITLQNVGTDASGNAYDLKITMTACKGKTLNKYLTEGIRWGSQNYYVTDTMVQLCLCGPNSVISAVETSKRITFHPINLSSGDCTLKFQYLKHGTTTVANAAMFALMHDIDTNNYPKATFAQSDMDKYSMFKGCEGIQVSGAKLYLSSSTILSSDASSGKVWISAEKAVNTDGLNWKTGCVIAGTSATTTITFGAHSNLNWYSKFHTEPSAPNKGVEITS